MWTPAKRNIVREWHNWAKNNPKTAEGDNAFGDFYLHLQRNTAELLTFSADDKFKTVCDWLAEEGLIKL